MQIILRKANGKMTKHRTRIQYARLQFPAVIVLINLYHLLSLVYIYGLYDTGTLVNFTISRDKCLVYFMYFLVTILLYFISYNIL